MQVSRKEIKNFNIRGYFNECCDYIEEAGDNIIMVECGLRQLWDYREMEEDEKRIQKLKEEIRQRFWWLFIAAEQHGQQLPFKSAKELTNWTYSSLRGLFEVLYKNSYNKDVSGVDEELKEVFEEKLQELRAEAREGGRFCANVNEYKLQEYEKREFPLLLEIVRGRICFSIVEGWGDWKRKTRELAEIEYYKEIADLEGENKDEDKRYKTNARPKVKMLKDWGYFEALKKEGATQTAIGEEIAAILGCSPNYGRKIYRKVAGLTGKDEGE